MVFRHISKDIKNRTLFLLENDYIPADVAETLGVSERSISIARWANDLEAFGSVITNKKLVNLSPSQNKELYITKTLRLNLNIGN